MVLSAVVGSRRFDLGWYGGRSFGLLAASFLLVTLLLELNKLYGSLGEALETIAEYLKTGWTTGGGRRLRQFVWSLWNGHHLINLYDLSSGLDGRLTDAVIVVFNAAMVDALSEDQKRRVLKESGEFARWEQASTEIPDDEDVLYPPFPMSTDGLRRLAKSAERQDRRLEAERRAKQDREAADE